MWVAVLAGVLSGLLDAVAVWAGEEDGAGVAEGCSVKAWEGTGTAVVTVALCEGVAVAVLLGAGVGLISAVEEEDAVAI